MARMDGCLGRIAVALALLGALGCGGPGGTAPQPPEDGGETGDPGVEIPEPFTSVVDSGEPGGDVPGDCEPPPITSAVPARGPLALDAGGGRNGRVAMAALPDGRLATAERRFGVVLVDDAGDDLQVAGPGWLFDDEPLSVFALSDARLLLLTRGTLTLLDVSGASASELAAVELSGRAVDAVLAEGDDDTRALYVVVDELTADVNLCGERNRTTLRGIVVEPDGLLAEEAIDLGRDVTAALLSPGRALIAHVPEADDPQQLWRFEPAGSSSLQLLELSPDGQAQDRGTVATASGVVLSATHMQLRGDLLEVASALFEDGVRLARDARLEHFDLADPGSGQARAGCAFPWDVRYATAVYEAQGIRTVTFVGEALAVIDRRESDGTFRGRLVGMADADACEVTSLPVPHDALPLATPEGRLLVVGRDPQDAQLQLYDVDDPGQPVASLELGAGVRSSGSGVLVGARVFDDAIDQQSDAGVAERTLVAIPMLGQPAEQDVALALVSISESSMTARGRLDGVRDLRAFESRLVGTSRTHLLELELEAMDAPDLISERARAETWPVGDAAVAFEHTIAQLRDVDDAPRIELLAPELHARQVLGSTEAHPDAQLFAIGGHLVTLEPSSPQEVCAGEPGARVRVHDVGDPAAPQELGVLESDEIDLCRDHAVPALTGRGWVGVSGGWIALRGERTVGEEAEVRGEPGFPYQVYELRLVDVRDPAAPRIQTLTRPDEERGRHLVLHDGVLHYSYALLVPESDPPEEEVYVVPIDLREGDPQVGEPVNVPGPVVAVDGEALYTRELQRVAGDPVYSLHRVVLDGDGESPRARIVASFEAGSERPADPIAHQGQLLVTLVASAAPLYGADEEQPARLLVLDGEALTVSGELPLSLRARTVAADGTHLVLHERYGGGYIIDLDDPADPQVLHELGTGLPLTLQPDRLLYLHGAHTDAALVALPL